MNYQESLDWIHATERFGSRLGLKRMQELLHRLGDPQKGLPVIHIAGTNGKGATATLIAEALQAAGFCTGKYISPFVLEFRERMQLDGEMIPRETLAALATEVRAAAEAMAAEGMPPTEFELVTAIGFLWFHRSPSELAVMEVGLGGRLDATNVIDPPLVTVLARIDYDHTAILGDTLTAIAGEKCGIIKPGSRVVAYPDQEEEALTVIRNRCREEGVPLTLPDRSEIKVLEESLSGNRFLYQGTEYTVPLAGPHQVLNAVTALTALAGLDNTPFAVPLKARQAGLAAVHFPARFEVIRQDPPVLLDGAHNPNGADALAGALRDLRETGLTAVCGMLRDKDCRSAIGRVAPFCRRMIITSVANPRACPPEELAKIAREFCSDVTVEPDLKKAIAAALADGSGVLVFGSLYLASDARPLLKEVVQA